MSERAPGGLGYMPEQLPPDPFLDLPEDQYGAELNQDEIPFGQGELTWSDTAPHAAKKGTQTGTVKENNKTDTGQDDSGD